MSVIFGVSATSGSIIRAHGPARALGRAPTLAGARHHDALVWGEGRGTRLGKPGPPAAAVPARLSPGVRSGAPSVPCESANGDDAESVADDAQSVGSCHSRPDLSGGWTHRRCGIRQTARWCLRGTESDRRTRGTPGPTIRSDEAPDAPPRTEGLPGA